MALQWAEMPGRESTLDPPTLKTKWVFEGTWDWNTVASAAMNNIPLFAAHPAGTLYRQDVSISEIGHALYHVTVPYGPLERVAGAYTLSFDTTGGTVHIANSKETISKNAISGETAPDYKQLIGVTPEGVEGTEIVIPALKINVTFKHPAGVITNAQMRQLARNTGKVDNGGFLGFAAGETLFLGASGNAGTDSETTIGYQFAMSENESSLSIGDIVAFAKKGWEYVWLVYKDATDTAGGTDYPVKQPRFAYVERVYNTVGLAGLLGFGA